MNDAEVAVNAAALLASGLAMFGAGWALYRYQQRPRFVCGVPPCRAEMQRKHLSETDIGRDSLIGFLFSRSFLAVRLHWPRYKAVPSRGDRRKATAAKRERQLSCSPTGNVTLPVILSNVGRRTALDYGLSVVVFDGSGSPSRVRIRKVETDGPDFSLSVDRPDMLDEPSSVVVPSEVIARAKDEFFPATSSWGDGVYAWGTRIETGSWDLICLELAVGEGVGELSLVFTVSCSDSWVRDALYYQVIRFVPSQEAAAAS